MIQHNVNAERNGKENGFALSHVLKILYQALLQSIEDPFRILDRGYRLLWINKKLPCQHVGQICHEEIFKRSDPCADCPVTQVFETGKPSIVNKSTTHIDGSETWREVRAYPVFDSTSEVVYALTVGHDFTDRRMDLLQQQKHIETLQNALYRAAQSDFESIYIPDNRPATNLTERELQVLRLMANGLTNNDISGILSLSPHTVKTHVINIFNKLGVNDRTLASTLAVRLNLI